MFCNIFHQWTDWQQYSASVPGSKGNDKEIGNEKVKTLQFRDCNGCSKRQIKQIRIKRLLRS